MGLKYRLQVAVWAVGAASTGAALASLPADLPASHQNVKVYMGTNPTDFRPRNATLVVETDVIKEIKIPFGSPIKVWGPKCDTAVASQAECSAATKVYGDVQKTTGALDDHRLGPGDTVHVIIMDKNHPDNFRGLYDPATQSVVLYPNRSSGTTPHEVAHVYVRKHHGILSQPKGGGVNEGFAKSTAHRVTGNGGALPPSADNVSAILNGTNCTTPSSWQCKHDIGNLVFEAYEKLADEMGPSGAFDVYRKALLRIKGRVTPSELHRAAAEILEEDLPPIPIFLPPISDPFVLGDWEAWLLIYWTWC